MATKKAAKGKRGHGQVGSSKKSGQQGVKSYESGARGGGKLTRPPAEDPIIVGGGSVFLDFDKTFAVSDHPDKPGVRRRGAHPNASAEITQIVFLTRIKGGVVTRRITLTASEKAVAICYTGSDCP